MKKRDEEKQAKKDYKKLLKKYGFKKELDQIDDYDTFYNSKEDSTKQLQSDEEDEMSIHFKNERERNFYENGKDMDFVRYHKRVTKNF